MTRDVARLLARIPRARYRMACDDMATMKYVCRAREYLRSAGARAHDCRPVYALVAWNAGPDEAWERCIALEDQGFEPRPMWYHALDCLSANCVSERQRELGWDDGERLKIMGHFYWRRGRAPESEGAQA